MPALREPRSARSAPSAGPTGSPGRGSGSTALLGWATAVRKGEHLVADTHPVQRVVVVDDDARERVNAAPEADPDARVDQLGGLAAWAERFDRRGTEPFERF